MAIARTYSLWINGELIGTDIRPHFYNVEQVRGKGFNINGEPWGRGFPKARFWWDGEIKMSIFNHWASLVGQPGVLSAWLDSVTLIDGDYEGTRDLPYHARYPGGILGRITPLPNAYPDTRNGELYYIGGAEFWIYELGKQRST